MGSSGYGSHGSSGSHEHPLSIASSSDSNGNGNTANSGSKINGNTRREEGKSKPVIILLSMHILIPELALNNSISKISVFFIYLLIFYVRTICFMLIFHLACLLQWGVIRYTKVLISFNKDKIINK